MSDVCSDHRTTVSWSDATFTTGFKPFLPEARVRLGLVPTNENRGALNSATSTTLCRLLRTRNQKGLESKFRHASKGNCFRLPSTTWKGLNVSGSNIGPGSFPDMSQHLINRFASMLARFLTPNISMKQLSRNPIYEKTVGRCSG
jgi:hypothetical protein